MNDVAAWIIGLITAYGVGGLRAAPVIMRHRYLDRLAEIKDTKDEFDRDVLEWKRAKDSSSVRPWPPRTWKDAELRHNARFEGWWFSLVWPFALIFHRAGQHAFAQEIAAERATENARIIADYDRLLVERFDRELAQPAPRTTPIRTLTRNLLQRLVR